MNFVSLTKQTKTKSKLKQKLIFCNWTCSSYWIIYKISIFKHMLSFDSIKNQQIVKTKIDWFYFSINQNLDINLHNIRPANVTWKVFLLLNASDLFKRKKVRN